MISGGVKYNQKIPAWIIYIFLLKFTWFNLAEHLFINFGWFYITKVLTCKVNYGRRVIPCGFDNKVVMAPQI